MTKPQQAPPGANKRRFSYPPSPAGAVVDVLHGVSVPDPYRWLEDSNNPETQAWIVAQNRLTRGFLDRIPERAAIVQRLRELWDFERFEAPFERGGRYFYFYNSGLQNQPALYWLKALDAQPEQLLDPNLLSTDGTVALTHVEPTADGKLIAYDLSRAGSDWTEWRVRRVDDGQDLPDLILWSKFSSVAWRKDGAGFYYSRYEEPKPGKALSEANFFNKLYFHRLGQPQSADALIYEERKNPKRSFGASTKAALGIFALLVN